MPLTSVSTAPTSLAVVDAATSVRSRALSGVSSSFWYHGVLSSRAARATTGAATSAPSCQGAMRRTTSVVGGLV